MPREATPGDRDHPVAGGLQGGEALAIALERPAAAVEGPAVELDDEPVGRPERVHLVALDENVAGRQREVLGAAEVEEEGFELALRARRIVGFTEECEHWLDAASAVASGA